jgi:hypothetical protein
MKRSERVATTIIITPNCQRVHGREGAIDEALSRVKTELGLCVKGWKDKAEFEIKVTVKPII